MSGVPSPNPHSGERGSLQPPVVRFGRMGPASTVLPKAGQNFAQSYPANLDHVPALSARKPRLGTQPNANVYSRVTWRLCASTVGFQISLTDCLVCIAVGLHDMPCCLDVSARVC